MTCSFFRLTGGRRFILALMLLALIAAPHTAGAQTVADPRFVEFDPSPDHDTLFNGIAVVEKYLFKVYQVGGSQPVHTLDIGKPVPDVDGTIRVDFSTSMGDGSLPGGEYEARVSAEGPGGSGISPVSNSFILGSPCSYALSKTSASLPSVGGGAQVGLTTEAGCAWTAGADVSWLTLGATGGTGPATILISVAQNTGAADRTGTVTIAGLSYTVSQQGAGCGYSLTSSTQTFPASGGTGSVGVTSTGGCTWTATSNDSWITVTSASSSSVAYTVAANTATTSRAGSITIAGLSHTVNQAGAVASGGGGVPAPWQSQDVGTVGISGDTTYSSGVFTARGAGAGITGNSDAFHFVHQPIAGDSEVVARVTSLATSTCANGTAGLMLRQTLDPGSRHLLVTAVPGGGIQVLQRATPGGKTTTVAQSTGPLPAWLKIARSGRTVTLSTSTSADGTTWAVLARVNSKFIGSALIGLGVTSADPTLLNTAGFDNVSVR